VNRTAKFILVLSANPVSEVYEPDAFIIKEGSWEHYFIRDSTLKSEFKASSHDLQLSIDDCQQRKGLTFHTFSLLLV